MARQQLLGFGEGVRLIAFKEEEVIPALDLGDLTAIGFDRRGRAADRGDARQIQVRQVRGDGRFFVGIAGDGHLIDEPLLGRLKMDQGQGFFGLGLLLVCGRIQAGGCGH